MNGTISSPRNATGGFLPPHLALRNSINRAAASPSAMFRSIRVVRVTRTDSSERIVAAKLAAITITAFYIGGSHA